MGYISTQQPCGLLLTPLEPPHISHHEIPLIFLCQEEAAVPKPGH